MADSAMLESFAGYLERLPTVLYRALNKNQASFRWTIQISRARSITVDYYEQ